MRYSKVAHGWTRSPRLQKTPRLLETPLGAAPAQRGHSVAPRTPTGASFETPSDGDRREALPARGRSGRSRLGDPCRPPSFSALRTYGLGLSGLHGLERAEEDGRYSAGSASQRLPGVRIWGRATAAALGLKRYGAS